MPDNSIHAIDPDRLPKTTRWHRDKSHANILDTFLRTPTGELLIDVLREFAIPEQTPQNLGLANVIELQAKLAFIQCINSGQHLTVENLLSLRHSKEDSGEDTLEEWTGDARVSRKAESQKEV